MPEYQEDEISGVRERPSLGASRQEKRSSKRRQAEHAKSDEARARQLAQMIQSVEGVSSPARVEEPMPMVTDVPSSKPGILTRWGERLRHSRMLKTALVAIGLHVPATPAGQRIFGDAVEWVKGVRADWEKPGMVIHPQSQAERDGVVAKMYENGARSDAAAASRAKDDFNRRLEQGQDVPLDRMYFELARTAGEDPERVKEAQRRKDELVARLAERMGDDMSDAFIRSVVDEMYGPDSNYVWGQGSATEYFVTGKRNCAAIARAEQMVFESLLAKLPPEKRKLYQLGLAMEKQHEIATLTVMNADGSVNRTLYLEPPVRPIQGARETAGSPTVDMATVKRAMASKEPVRVKVPAKPGQEIADSPDIDVITNEPVSLNLKAEGKLRGSGYVERVAEDRGIKPVKAPPEKLTSVQELSIETGEKPPEVKTANSQAEMSLAKLETASAGNPGSPMYLTLHELNSSDQLKILNSWKGPRIDEIFIENWNYQVDREFIDEFRKLPADIVWLQAPPYEDSDFVHVLAALSKLTPEEQRNAPTIGIRTNYHASFDSPDRELESAAIEVTLASDHPDSEGDHEGEDAAEIRLFKQEIKNNELVAIAQFRAKRVFLKGDILTGLTPADLDILLVGNEGRTYYLDAVPYLKFLVSHPEAVSRTQFKPWINQYISETELTELLVLAKGQPAVLKVIKEVAAATGQKFKNSWISL